MAHIDRFSVSLDTELLAAFDRHIAAKGYDNRSEAIRDMIRELLVAGRFEEGDEPAAAVLTFACDHDVGEVTQRVRGVIAKQAERVRGSFSAPIDPTRDIVAVVLIGPVSQIQGLANEIQAMRGITHAHLSVMPGGE